MADPTESILRGLWPSFKRRLSAQFPNEEWIRPMYLLKVLRASPAQLHLLATVPLNGKIISAAVTRLPAMREMLKPSFNISLTTYPDEWQISEARKRYGVDIAPKSWTRKAG